VSGEGMNPRQALEIVRKTLGDFDFSLENRREHIMLLVEIVGQLMARIERLEKELVK
jgi:hypothetical protein